MNKERKLEVRRLIMEEMRLPLQWWWLSFADETGFLGAAIIQAGGIIEAASTAERLGCNPGGQVLAYPIADFDLPPEEHRERLLGEPEANELAGRINDHAFATH
jgi:hypothetical protein